MLCRAETTAVVNARRPISMLWSSVFEDCPVYSTNEQHMISFQLQRTAVGSYVCVYLTCIYYVRIIYLVHVHSMIPGIPGIVQRGLRRGGLTLRMTEDIGKTNAANATVLPRVHKNESCSSARAKKVNTACNEPATIFCHPAQQSVFCV